MLFGFVLSFSLVHCVEDLSEGGGGNQNFLQERDTMPLGIVRAPGATWQYWTDGDSIQVNGVALMSQDSLNGKQRMVTDEALIEWIYSLGAGNFFIHDRWFSFSIPAYTIAIPDNATGYNNLETVDVSVGTIPESAVTEVGDSFPMPRGSATYAGISSQSGDSLRIVGSFINTGSFGTPTYLSVLYEPITEFPEYSLASSNRGNWTSVYTLELEANSGGDIDTTIQLSLNAGDRFMFAAYNGYFQARSTYYYLKIEGVK